jgi:hypothetical protein
MQSVSFRAEIQLFVEMNKTSGETFVGPPLERVEDFGKQAAQLKVSGNATERENHLRRGNRI